MNNEFYRRVFGRMRLVLVVDVPSKICKSYAVRSSGEMRLKHIGFLVGDVIDLTFSFSISKRIFSFRRRRSSSTFQSRCLRIRHGSGTKNTQT